MKEIQIPRKNSARSSDPATKRIIIKDPELKNRKRQSATVGSTKDPSDFDPIYFAISDHEAESFLQGSSVDLLPTPEICDESPVSTVSNEAFQVIDAAIAADLPASVQSLRAEISDLKKTICSVESSEESKRVDGAVTLKFRVVVFAFVLWALFAAVVVGVSSGEEEVAYSGPVPT
ncbi:hypothetical protein IGI04_020925 [Brassica rapa subsp. trilocularis]|uniref:Uncharacterized protein n=1 Tax=Brassica rapa subsp. trilocularis TaxID=1813537 RepID=A0ABQ7MNE2_BRACM|nr:hypothetical protein IGI04_020925 [Brassica rapa subsp. trilocularis]